MSKNEYAHLPVWPAADTPCIGYCSTNLGDSICMGCGRTMDEIDGWLFKSEEEKAQCWVRIQAAGVGYRWESN
jgi:predicted Fe-S protein YdhL (DUF1289 family)